MILIATDSASTHLIQSWFSTYLHITCVWTEPRYIKNSDLDGFFLLKVLELLMGFKHFVLFELQLFFEVDEVLLFLLLGLSIS